MVAATQPDVSGVSCTTHDAGAPENADGDLFRAFEDEIDAIGGAIAPPRRRGPGRPPGSVNRTTLQLQRFLQARGYRDPAEMLAAIASADLHELARAMMGYAPDFTGPVMLDPDIVSKAVGHQRAAAADLMPYFHQRAPARVDDAGKDENATRVMIVINDSKVNVSSAGNADEGQQLQTLSINDPLPVARMSDDAASDDGK